MQIHGASQVHSAQAVNAPHHQRPAQPASPPTRVDTVDEVQLSNQAQLVSQANELPEIRADRVAAVKQLIESGQYETPERFEAAIDNLLDELV